MTQNTFHGKIDRNVVTIGRKNMGKKTDKSTVGLILGFVKRMQEDHIGAYAAQAAYFLIMSFIPFVLVLTALVQYTPLTYRMLRQVIIGFVPDNLQDFVLKIIAEVFTKSAAVVPISGLFALWSSGKGMQSLIAGLNVIYHVKETRNWLTNRLYSMLYMFLFIIAIITSLLLLVMGNRIHAELVVHFLVFLVLYRYLPNRKASLKSQVPGAFIIAVAWSMFSYFFSLYFTFFPNFSNMYGSLSALIMVMLWLYVCMNLLLYGAELNAYFEKQFRQAQYTVWQQIKKLLDRFLALWHHKA